METEQDKVFRALGDSTRRRLLELIGARESSVKELTDAFDMSQSAISQHLRVLREAGLTTERKVGRNRLYRLESRPLHHVEQWVRENADFWTERLEGLGRYLRKNDGKKDQL